MAISAGQVQVQIKAIDRATNVIKGISGTLKGLMGVAAGYISLRAVTSTVKDLSQSFMRQEKAEVQLNSVLRSTGQIAGVTSERAMDLAKSLSDLTSFADESILEAENLMLTFTKINSEVFPDAIEMALNMSTVLGQDMKSSVIQLGKALNDPIIGATALRRVGVSLTDQQMDQIKVLMEQNDLYELKKLS